MEEEEKRKEEDKRKIGREGRQERKEGREEERCFFQVCIHSLNRTNAVLGVNIWSSSADVLRSPHFGSTLSDWPYNISVCACVSLPIYLSPSTLICSNDLFFFLAFVWERDPLYLVEESAVFCSSDENGQWMEMASAGEDTHTPLSRSLWDDAGGQRRFSIWRVMSYDPTNEEGETNRQRFPDIQRQTYLEEQTETDRHRHETFEG